MTTWWTRSRLPRGAHGLSLSPGASPKIRLVDPGIGFGKTVRAQPGPPAPARTASPSSAGPWCWGRRARRFLGAILGVGPAERGHRHRGHHRIGALAGAHVFRVHEVKPQLRGTPGTLAVLRGRREPCPAAGRARCLRGQVQSRRTVFHPVEGIELRDSAGHCRGAGAWARLCPWTFISTQASAPAPRATISRTPSTTAAWRQHRARHRRRWRVPPSGTLSPR